jgi:hypothetical protein
LGDKSRTPHDLLDRASNGIVQAVQITFSYERYPVVNAQITEEF